MERKAVIAMVATVALACAVRLAWLILVVNRQWSDVAYYDEAAQHLAHYGELRYIDPTVSSIHYWAWFPPGWPCFMAIFHLLCGDSAWIVKLVNLALAGLIAFLTIQIGAILFERRVGLIGALLWAILPGQIVYVSLGQYEVFLTALTVGIIYLLILEGWETITWHSARLHMLGLLIAWATMTRPLLALLPVALAPYLIQIGGKRRGWLWTGIITAYIGVACAGWGLRNHAVLGEAVLFSTNGGYNLWHGNNPNATGGAFTPHGSDPRLNPLLLQDNELEMNRKCYQYAMEYIREHPGRFLAMVPRRLYNLYYTDTTGLYLAFIYTPLERPTILERFRQNPHLAESLVFRTYLITMVFVLIGLFTANWQAPRIRLIGYIILYWHFWVALTFGQDRYRVPLMPIYCLFAAYAMQRLLNFGQQRLRPAPAPALELAG